MFSQDDRETENFVSKAVQTLKRYDPNKFSFLSWQTDFLNVAQNLNVPKSKKTALFCSMLEPKIYTALKKHVLPRHPTRLSYEDLVKNLETCPPMINTRNVRIRFKARKQRDDETIEMYAKNLENIYKKCQYKFVDDKVLVDQFLYGLRNREIASHLQKTRIRVYKVAVGWALEFEEKDMASTSRD
ncbi:PREDICTED: uncharacterized protein LOC106790555 [Polistes canadensis]|uniref:uncharacterized protein LOC106790555 n=1 Tax=Polistes canadensis TaxID=91411 RepID=UPI000718B187|nr:PREDICTED: uncharacterized protein LOC106790555 [Polistes canadensis]